MENMEQIRFSKFLATIKTDVPIRFDAAKCIREKMNEERLVEIYTELEFRTFINRMSGEPEKSNGVQNSTGASKKPIQEKSSSGRPDSRLALLKNLRPNLRLFPNIRLSRT